ncbi:MAG: hypothetical protein J6L58_02870 [Clostridia bacterium]|nr:hypothetical protein [Clostridia bacterium]
MKYKKLLKELSAKNNIPVKQLEKEMQNAINAAGLDCTVKEFIEKGTELIKQRLYIV